MRACDWAHCMIASVVPSLAGKLSCLGSRLGAAQHCCCGPVTLCGAQICPRLPSGGRRGWRVPWEEAKLVRRVWLDGECNSTGGYIGGYETADVWSVQ